MSYWQRKAGVLATLALTAIFFPAVISTPHRLFEFYENLFAEGRGVSKDWGTGRAGETVLPQKVQTMLALLRNHQITEFRYSDAIARDPDDSVPQRLAEGAYPILISTRARHWLLSASEAVSPGCLVLAAREGVVLAHCP